MIPTRACLFALWHVSPAAVCIASVHIAQALWGFFDASHLAAARGGSRPPQPPPCACVCGSSAFSGRIVEARALSAAAAAAAVNTSKAALARPRQKRRRQGKGGNSPGGAAASDREATSAADGRSVNMASEDRRFGEAVCGPRQTEEEEGAEEGRAEQAVSGAAPLPLAVAGGPSDPPPQQQAQMEAAPPAAAVVSAAALRPQWSRGSPCAPRPPPG